MPSGGFEPTIPAGERLQTHALDRSATGIGYYARYVLQIKKQQMQRLFWQRKYSGIVDMTGMRPQQLYSFCFPIHCLLMILPFDVA
jgi:hypothetical protein